MRNMNQKEGRTRGKKSLTQQFSCKRNVGGSSSLCAPAFVVVCNP
jgi:hypothetical protein